MKRLITLCVATMSAALLAAPQRPVSPADADRSRKEALQHYRLGQDAMRGERFDVAEQEFQQSAKLDPTLELAPYGLGQVYMATRRFHPAVVAFTRSREVILANSVATAGNELARERRLNDEIRELEDQQTIYSQQLGRNGNTSLVRAYLQTLTVQIAAMKSAKMQTLNGPAPVPSWISLALGSAYFRTDAIADAEREYLAAIEVDPRLGEAHNNLAVVYLQTGRAAQAEAALKAAEKAGFKVNPQLKEDVKKALAAR